MDATSLRNFACPEAVACKRVNVGLRLRPFGNAQQDAQEHLLRTLGVSAPLLWSIEQRFGLSNDHCWLNPRPLRGWGGAVKSNIGIPFGGRRDLGSGGADLTLTLAGQII